VLRLYGKQKLPWETRAFPFRAQNTYFWQYPEQFKPVCFLYVIGGYGGWNDSYYYYSGLRSRNDVWVTSDGCEWPFLSFPMATRQKSGLAWQ
jgi:hypothetical protein